MAFQGIPKDSPLPNDVALEVSSKKKGTPVNNRSHNKIASYFHQLGPRQGHPLTLVTKGPPALLTSGSPLVALGHPWVTSDTPEQRHTTGPTVNSNAGNIHRLMKMPCRLPQPCNSQIDNFVLTFR